MAPTGLDDASVGGKELAVLAKRRGLAVPPAEHRLDRRGFFQFWEVRERWGGNDPKRYEDITLWLRGKADVANKPRGAQVWLDLCRWCGQDPVPYDALPHGNPLKLSIEHWFSQQAAGDWAVLRNGIMGLYALEMGFNNSGEFKTLGSPAEIAFFGQRSYRNHVHYLNWLHTKQNYKLPSLHFLQSTHCVDTELATPIYLSSGLRATGLSRQLRLPFGAAQGLRSGVKRARVEEAEEEGTGPAPLRSTADDSGPSAQAWHQNNNNPDTPSVDGQARGEVGQHEDSHLSNVPDPAEVAEVAEVALPWRPPSTAEVERFQRASTSFTDILRRLRLSPWRIDIATAAIGGNYDPYIAEINCYIQTMDLFRASIAAMEVKRVGHVRIAGLKASGETLKASCGRSRMLALLGYALHARLLEARRRVDIADELKLYGLGPENTATISGNKHAFKALGDGLAMLHGFLVTLKAGLQTGIRNALCALEVFWTLHEHQHRLVSDRLTAKEPESEHGMWFRPLETHRQLFTVDGRRVRHEKYVYACDSFLVLAADALALSVAGEPQGAARSRNHEDTGARSETVDGQARGEVGQHPAGSGHAISEDVLKRGHEVHEALKRVVAKARKDFKVPVFAAPASTMDHDCIQKCLLFLKRVLEEIDAIPEKATKQMCLALNHLQRSTSKLEEVQMQAILLLGSVLQALYDDSNATIPVGDEITLGFSNCNGGKGFRCSPNGWRKLKPSLSRLRDYVDCMRDTEVLPERLDFFRRLLSTKGLATEQGAWVRQHGPSPGGGVRMASAQVLSVRRHHSDKGYKDPKTADSYLVMAADALALSAAGEPRCGPSRTRTPPCRLDAAAAALPRSAGRG